MERSIAYAEVYSNFGSAYNALPQAIYAPPTQTGIYPSFLFNGNRPSSPLFHRSSSPPPTQITIPTGRRPKFNFDLYKMDGSNDDSCLMSPRPSSIVVHHRPIYSTFDPIATAEENQPAALTKLREINDELYYTLARPDLPSTMVKHDGPHYHIHHYPVSQHSHETYRIHSPPEYFSPSVTRESPPKANKARVTYKIHIPRRYRPEKSHRKSSSTRIVDDDNKEEIYISEESSRNDSIVVDMYPTRDKRRDEQSNPWIVHGRSVRRNSNDDDEHTDRSTNEHREFYYGDKPIQSHRPSTHRKDRQPSGVRHRAPFVSSHYRPESAPAYESDPYRDSGRHFVHNEASGRPATTSREKSKIKSSSHRPTTERNDENRRNKHILAFDSQDEPTPRPKYEKRRERRSPTATESESGIYQRTNIRKNDQALKERITNAESKVKTAWGPTVIGKSSRSTKNDREQSVVSEPPASTSNDHNSFSDIPKQPATETTPKDQSRTSEPPKKQRTPTPPPPPSNNTTITKPEEPPKKDEPIETTKPDAPKANFFDSDSSLVPAEHHDEEEPKAPTPPPPPSPQPPAEESKPKSKIPSPVPSEKSNDQSVHDDPEERDDDDDEADKEVAFNFDFKNWLNDAANAIRGVKTNDEPAVSSTPVQPAEPPKISQKTTPRRKPQPASPAPSSPDRDLYKPPFGPKKTQPKAKIDSPPVTPLITSSAADADNNDNDDEANSFFD